MSFSSLADQTWVTAAEPDRKVVNVDIDWSPSRSAELPTLRTSTLEKGLIYVYSNEFDRALSLFVLESSLAEIKDPTPGDYAKQAEALLGLACCYSAMSKTKQAKKTMISAFEAVGKAYSRVEDFEFFPVLETLIKLEDLDSKYKSIADKLTNPTLEGTLTSIDIFIDQRKDSFFKTLALAWRAVLLYKMKRLEETEESARPFIDLYPKSSIALEWNMIFAYESQPLKSMEFANEFESIFGKNDKISAFKGVINAKLQNYKEAFKYLKESLESKQSKVPGIYITFFVAMAGCNMLCAKESFEIFDNYVEKRSKVLLQVLETYLPEFAKKCPMLRNRIDFIRLRCLGLCFFKLGIFDNAVENFKLACDKTLREQVESEMRPFMIFTDAFSHVKKLAVGCEEKIVECEIAKARHMRAAKMIRRALVEAMYRPGGPGYVSAFEHFRAVAASR